MRGCALRAWKVVPVIIACEIWSVSISVEWMRVVLNGFLITKGRVCVWNISGADCVSNDKENTSNVSHAPFRPAKINECFRDLHSGRSSMPRIYNNFRLSEPFEFSSNIYSGVKRAGFIGLTAKWNTVFLSRKLRKEKATSNSDLSVILFRLRTKLQASSLIEN